jgi:hypothetical protein
MVPPDKTLNSVPNSYLVSRLNVTGTSFVNRVSVTGIWERQEIERNKRTTEMMGRFIFSKIT